MLTRVTGRHPQRRLVALFVLPYVLLGLVWALANPAFAAPDEDAHLVKALGLAHFDIGSPAPPAPEGAPLGTVRNASISRVVTIPARLDPSGYACFMFRADVTAACQPAAPPSASGDASVATTLGAYPPFLYPPLGWAAGLGANPVQADVLGRLAVLAVSAVLLWLACAHLARWLGPRSLLGMPVLLTPIAVYCLGILNTSAVEILGAAGMAAVVVGYSRRPESLAAAGTQSLVLVSGTALVLSRQLGVVTMALLTGLLLALGGWREVWAGLRERRPVTWAAVAVPALATIAVGLWELGFDHPVLLGPWVSGDSLQVFWQEGWQLVQESVGWFGWLDVRPPGPVNLVWVVAGVALVGAGFVLGDRHDWTVLAVVAVAGLLVCYLTFARVFFPIEAGLQGRHVLPVFALVPLWSGVVVAERAPVRAVRLAVGVSAVALPLVVLAGLYLNGRRYAVGLGDPSGPLWFVPEAQWAPTLGWYPWILLALFGCALLGRSWAVVNRSADPRRGRAPSRATGPAGSAPGP